MASYLTQLLRVVYDSSKTSSLIFLHGECVRLVFLSPSAVLSCLPSQELCYFSLGEPVTVWYLVRRREGEEAALPCTVPPAITDSLKAFYFLLMQRGQCLSSSCDGS